MRVLHSRGTTHPICELGVGSSLRFATQQLDSLTVPSTPYVFNNCIYFWSHLLAGTNTITIDLITIKDYFFFSASAPNNPPFRPVGDCDCRWLHNDFSIPRAPENMSHKKEAILFFIFPHLDVIYPYHCNILGLSRFFNKNILSYLREASRTSSPR